jgi:hypothetical protein
VAALTLGKIARYGLERRLGGSQTRCGRYGEEISVFTLTEFDGHIPALNKTELLCLTPSGLFVVPTKRFNIYRSYILLHYFHKVPNLMLQVSRQVRYWVVERVNIVTCYRNNYLRHRREYKYAFMTSGLCLLNGKISAKYCVNFFIFSGE